MNAMGTTESELQKLIIRSAELDSEVKRILNKVWPMPLAKCRLAIAMAGISIEHADSIRMVVFSHHLTSAMGLLRLQYESTARALWLAYVANDEYIAKHDTPLTLDDDGHKNDLPIDKLLKEMELSKDFPKQAYFSLVEFKKESWKALGSYVHSGKHPLHRKQAGYPFLLLYSVILHSNQLMCMSAMTAIAMSGNEKIKDEFWVVQNNYKDCFQAYSPKPSNATNK